MTLNKLTFIFLVLFPTITVGVYYHNFASKQYISEFRYIVQGNNQQGIDVLGMVTGLTGTSASNSDSLAIESYLISHSFIESLTANVDIRSIYSDTSYDWWARLGEGASQEKLLAYWEDNILEISFDSISGITTVAVSAFTPQSAYNISKSIIQISDDFINSISEQARTDALKFANKEVLISQNKLSLLREKLTTFSDTEKVIDAEQDAKAEQGIVAGLKQELASLEAKYKKLRSYMQPTAFQVQSLKNEIDSIQNQIMSQQKKWVSNINGKNVTTTAQDTARLKSELEFAEKLYLSALSALKQAQIETSQKQRYLDVIVPPNLPDEALMPERTYSTISFFLSAFMLWGIFSLILSSIRDHLDQ